MIIPISLVFYLSNNVEQEDIITDNNEDIILENNKDVIPENNEYINESSPQTKPTIWEILFEISNKRPQLPNMEIPKNTNDVVWDSLSKTLLEKVLTEHKFVNEFELTTYINSKLDGQQESIKKKFWDKFTENSGFRDLILQNNKDRIDSVIAFSPKDNEFKSELRKGGVS